MSKQCRKFTIVRKEIGIVWCQLKTQIARNKLEVLNIKSLYLYFYYALYIIFVMEVPFHTMAILHFIVILLMLINILHNHKCKNIILRAVN